MGTSSRGPFICIICGKPKPPKCIPLISLHTVPIFDLPHVSVCVAGETITISTLTTIIMIRCFNCFAAVSLSLIVKHANDPVIAHDRSKEFQWMFNRPVATKMIRLQNPLLRFHKTTKGNFSGEDFQISPFSIQVSFLDDCDSLAQILPY